MKKSDFQEILKKCFGKQKDDRYHAIAMLIIYGVFVFAVVVMIRVGGSSVSNVNQNNNDSNSNSNPTSSIPTPSSIPDIDSNPSMNENDINYSYSYSISYNGVSEVYLGKKVNDKEKFTLVKNGATTDYAILNDNYLILENGIYHITENPNRFFKYCDIEKILLLVENEIPTQNNNIMKYNLSNQVLATSFKDNISVDNEQNNSIQLHLSGETLKSVDLDFSNYISSIEGVESTLIIHMEFVDIGTTEDFEISIS